MTIDIEAAKEDARRYLRSTADTLRLVEEACLDDIVAAATILVESLSAGGKLLICGNGGSAADAQHLATEFVSTLTIGQPAPVDPRDRAHHRHVAPHRDRERLRHRGDVRAPGRSRSAGRATS